MVNPTPIFLPYKCIHFIYTTALQLLFVQGFNFCIWNKAANLKCFLKNHIILFFQVHESILVYCPVFLKLFYIYFFQFYYKYFPSYQETDFREHVILPHHACQYRSLCFCNSGQWLWSFKCIIQTCHPWKQADSLQTSLSCWLDKLFGLKVVTVLNNLYKGFW